MPDTDREVNDFQAVAWLNKICREFNCKVVVTSTWRGRSGEIYVWLNKKENKDIVNEIDDFIILDDDTDMGNFLMPHLIQTNTYRGLGYEEYEKICKRWESKNEN